MAIQILYMKLYPISSTTKKNQIHKTILLKNGIEKYIRKAKQTHANYKEAANDVLGDLGLDNYNL
ncbi:armadillo repeat-containing protein 6-like [Trifolium pratense]|uniref:Armadillo repeat-containing protein 6-like n=1 Tax=Trifolium pratense TaxID=57577 RepID=A0A2K3NAD1_TRIPR|nr:armadillo repeat-containing protein 6-like [Trifolium pratense]